MSPTTEQIKVEQGDHVVHFYQGAAELAATVGAYLADGLGIGGVAVAIATEPHFLAVERELAAVGIDVESAIDDGRLIFLDAHATLARVIVEGHIDSDAFEREVGSTIRGANEQARFVRAYGEMVDLLWQTGDITGAIELEGLWNGLMAELEFSLLCAYHSTAVAAPEHQVALREVCQLHSSVSSAPCANATAIHEYAVAREISRQFQPIRGTPRAARHFLESALHQWGYVGPLVDDARLLLSELVTNAVVHTRSPFSVSISSQQSQVRLAVHDTSPARPIPCSESPDALAGGHGLKIVAALASDWGVVTTCTGKTVWAELR